MVYRCVLVSVPDSSALSPAKFSLHWNKNKNSCVFYIAIPYFVNLLSYDY